MVIKEAEKVPFETFQLAKKYIKGDPEGSYEKFLDIRSAIYEATNEAISDLISNKGIYVDRKKLSDFDEFLRDFISNSPNDPSQLDSYIDDKIFKYLTSTIGTSKRRVTKEKKPVVEEVEKKPVEEKEVAKKVREKGIDPYEVETRKIIKDIRDGVNYDENLSKLFEMYIDMIKNIVYKHPGLVEFSARESEGYKKEKIPGSVYIDPKIEDIIAEAIDPFMKAIKDFDLEGDTKFSTFLYTYVDQYFKNLYTTKQISKLRQEGEFDFVLTRDTGKIDKLEDYNSAKLIGFNIEESKIIDSTGKEYIENKDYKFDGTEIEWIGDSPKEGNEYQIFIETSKPYKEISLSSPLSEDEESESTLEETIPESSVDILKLLESEADKIREQYAQSVGYDLSEEDKDMGDLINKIWVAIRAEEEDKKRRLEDKEIKDIILKMIENSTGIAISDLDLEDTEEKILYDKLVSAVDEIYNYLVKEKLTITDAKKKMTFFDLIQDYDEGTARRIMMDRFGVIPSTLTEWLSRHVNPSIAKVLGIEFNTPDGKLSSEHLYQLIKTQAK